MPKQPLQTLVRHLHKLVRPSEDGPADGRDLLLRFIKHQDSLAFAALVERHGPMVRGVCRRLLRQESDVDDAFQATFLVLLRKAPTIRKTQSVGSWLYGVAFRIASRARAESGRKSGHEKQGVPLAASRQCHTLPSDPGMEAAWRELCAVLDAEVHGLAEKFRAPIVLCYLEGQTRDQAARQLGWSLRTLDRRLEQGRERLRVRLARRGITLSAALLATGLSQQAGLCAIPPALLEQTLQAACGSAAGQTAAAISPKAIVLAETVLKGAVPVQLKVLAGVVLVAAVAIGGAALARQMLTANPPVTSEVNDSQPAEQTQQQAKTDAAKPARTDLHGDPLPPSAVARLGTVRWRQRSKIAAVAFSPDGKLLASASHDPIIYLWEVPSGKTRAALDLKNDSADRIAFAPDGKTLVSGGALGSIKFWDVATGRQVRQFDHKGEEAWIASLAFSPDGKSLAVALNEFRQPLLQVRNMRAGKPTDEARDAIVEIRTVATGKPVYQLKGHKDEVRSVVYSPNGKFIATAGTDTTRLWHAGSGKELWKWERGCDPIAFSPDGKILGGSDGGSLRLWDVDSGKELRRFETFSSTFLAFSPNGKYLAGGILDGTIRLWEMNTWKELPPLPGNGTPGDSGVFSPDGKFLAVASWDQTVAFWDMTTGKQVDPGGHRSMVSRLKYSPNGKMLASAGADNSLRLWDVARSREVWKVQSDWSCFAFSPDSKLLARGLDIGLIQIVETSSGKEVRQINEQPGNWKVGHSSWQLAFSPDGQTLASASADGPTWIWDVTTGKEIHKIIRKTNKRVNQVDLAFSPNGKTLALIESGHAEEGIDNEAIYLYATDSGKKLMEWKPGLSEGEGIIVFPSSHLLISASMGGPEGMVVHSWDLPSGKQLHHFALGEGGCGAVFSFDGRMLLRRGYKHTDLWEVATGLKIGEIPIHPTRRLSSFSARFAFSPNCRELASAVDCDCSILIWDLTPLLKRRPLPGNLATPHDMNTFWQSLADADASKAYWALLELVAAKGQTVSFFKDHLRPAVPIAAKKITPWLKDLDSNSFEMRSKATQQLEEVGEAAEPVLRKALAGRPSAEARHRATQILEKLGPLNPQRMRTVRAVAVLEYIGTSEAHDLLATLASGAPEARLTREAKAALERLARRSPSRR